MPASVHHDRHLHLFLSSCPLRSESHRHTYKSHQLAAACAIQAILTSLSAYARQLPRLAHDSSGGPSCGFGQVPIRRSTVRPISRHLAISIRKAGPPICRSSREFWCLIYIFFGTCAADIAACGSTPFPSPAPDDDSLQVRHAPPLTNSTPTRHLS